jgi:hypothetical protein
LSAGLVIFCYFNFIGVPLVLVRVPFYSFHKFQKIARNVIVSNHITIDDFESSLFRRADVVVDAAVDGVVDGAVDGAADVVAAAAAAVVMFAAAAVAAAGPDDGEP